MDKRYRREEVEAAVETAAYAAWRRGEPVTLEDLELALANKTEPPETSESWKIRITPDAAAAVKKLFAAATD